MARYETLEKRRAEREALLQRAVSLLQGDERIVAAWLYGSLGRGDADQWSDIDLWLVVSDQELESVLASRLDLVARAGATLITLDVPQNAPPGGAFMSVVYSEAAGPQHIDWTWQPRSLASIPPDTRVLFDRVGIPRHQAPAQTGEQKLAMAAYQVAFFWMMVPIVAKYVARGDTWKVLSLLDLLRNTLARIGSLAVAGGNSPVSDKWTIPPLTPANQLEMLLDMTDQLDDLMEKANLSGKVSPATESQVRGFLVSVYEIMGAGDRP